MSERERLVGRIRQIGRGFKTADEAARPSVAESEQDQLRALAARVAHLEALLQGLQDSVHRESLRHAKRIAELEARIEPATLGKALSDDARARGL